MLLPPKRNKEQSHPLFPLLSLVEDCVEQHKPLFITGTDTAIGKTHIAAMLLNYAASHNIKCAYYKPIETGCPIRGSSLGSEEISTVLKTAGTAVGARVSCTYRLKMPAAPYTASMKEGVVFDWARLDEELAAMQEKADLLVVEGAGGLMVPIEQHMTYLDLLKKWNMAPVLVVGNKLGCISAALLTDAALKQAGFEDTPLVLNNLHNQDPTASEFTNAWTLAATSGRPVVPVPYG